MAVTRQHIAQHLEQLIALERQRRTDCGGDAIGNEIQMKFFHRNLQKFESGIRDNRGYILSNVILIVMVILMLATIAAMKTMHSES